MDAATVGRVDFNVRNKKLLGFTTDYKGLMNDLPQLSVLS
jgi:shikimate 5-dehydrogenase